MKKENQDVTGERSQETGGDGREAAVGSRHQAGPSGLGTGPSPWYGLFKAHGRKFIPVMVRRHLTGEPPLEEKSSNSWSPYVEVCALEVRPGVGDTSTGVQDMQHAHGDRVNTDAPVLRRLPVVS